MFVTFAASELKLVLLNVEVSLYSLLPDFCLLNHYDSFVVAFQHNKETLNLWEIFK